MDYQRVYDEFIADRRGREAGLQKGEFDRHHIQPESLGGGNEPQNLIRLSFADHLFAHVLLARIYPDGPMALALRLMLDSSRYQGRRSRYGYAWVRRQASGTARRNALKQWNDPVGRAKMEIANNDPRVSVLRSVKVTARWKEGGDLKAAASSPQACANKKAAAKKRFAEEKDKDIVRRPALGLKHSEEFKERQRQRMLDRNNNPRARIKDAHRD